MTRKVWVVALLSVVSVLALVPQDSLALTAGQCEVFGRRGLIDDATRQACCREHNMACPEGTQGGFGGGASQSQGFGGAANGQGGGAADVGRSVAGGAAAGAAETSAQTGTSAGDAQSAVDAIDALGGGRSSGAETNAPQGWSGDRKTNTRTPEQDYSVKTNPYFYEDKSKYPQ